MTATKLAAARDPRSQGKKLQEIAETLSVSMSTLTRALGPRTGKPAPPAFRTVVKSAPPAISATPVLEYLVDMKITPSSHVKGATMRMLA